MFFAIYSSGSASLPNSSNIISNNNIADYWNVSQTQSGVYLGSNNDGWTISGNRFYQTTAALLSGSVHVIDVESGGGYTISNNVIGYANSSGTGGTSYSSNQNVQFAGIYYNSTSGTTSSIQGNTINEITFQANSNGALTPLFAGIYVASANGINIGTITGNTIGSSSGVGIGVERTGSLAFGSGIYVSSTGTSNINNNIIAGWISNSSMNFSGIKIAGSGSFTVNKNLVGSASTSKSINMSGGSVYGIENDATGAIGIGASGAANQLFNFYTSGTIYGIYNIANASNFSCTYNTISSFLVTGASTGTVAGIYNSGSPNFLIISNNNFQGGGNSLSTTGAIYGIYSYTFSASPAFLQIQSNTISSLTRNAAANLDFYGIYYQSSLSGNDAMVTGNTISSLTNSTTSSANVFGISFSGYGKARCYNNTIYGLSNQALSYQTVGVYSSIATTYLYNNRIGGLSNTIGSAAPTPSVVGVYPDGTTTCYLYDNTVYLNTTSSNSSFGTADVFTATTAPLAMKNNLLVNLSTSTGTGKTVTYQRSNATLSSYSTLSNNNDFYAANIYYDGTTAYTTLSAYQTAMSTRDGNSISESPHFLSTTGGNTNFLKINTAIGTSLESGGVRITSPVSITTDFEGDTRQGETGYSGTGTAPDIGADEFEGVHHNQNLSALTISLGTLSPSFSQGTVSYSVCEANATSSVKVTPTLSDGGASMQVRVNGGSYASVTNGAASPLLALNVGSNTIEILVTSYDAATTNTYNITVTVASSTPTISAGGSTTTCNGSSVALSSSSATNNQWYLNAVAITGANTQTYNASVSGTYTVILTSNSCNSSTSNSITVTVLPYSTWTGAVSTDWSDANNWCGSVPTGTTDVVIPGNAVNMPLIAATGSAQNVTLNSGATLTVTGAFNMYGSLTQTVAGAFDISNGSLYFDGTSVQSIPAFTAANVQMNGSGGVSLGGNSNISGTLSLTSGNILLNNYDLTIGSGATISGGSTSSHVVENGTGVLKATALNGSLLFALGTSASSYSPVTINNTSSKNWTVKLSGTVPSTGTWQHNRDRAIQRTWDITPSSTPGATNLSFQYNTADANIQGASFDPLLR